MYGEGGMGHGGLISGWDCVVAVGGGGCVSGSFGGGDSSGYGCCPRLHRWEYVLYIENCAERCGPINPSLLHAASATISASRL